MQQSFHTDMSGAILELSKNLFSAKLHHIFFKLTEIVCLQNQIGL